jgi:hypothetical protein
LSLIMTSVTTKSFLCFASIMPICNPSTGTRHSPPTHRTHNTHGGRSISYFKGRTLGLLMDTIIFLCDKHTKYFLYMHNKMYLLNTCPRLRTLQYGNYL